MSQLKPAADWTTGREAISFQACRSCQSIQYFRRSFCAACGSGELDDKMSSGEGTVYATSLVLRAGTPEAREHVPYNILLIDTAEGFRMMAHGANDLVIGDQVTARYAQFTGRLVPFFERIRQ
jgi:uncharacterized OB-fold protein